MLTTSAESLLNTIRHAGLVDRKRLADFLNDAPSRLEDVEGVGRALVRVGLLTVYQLNQLSRGEGRSLVVGPYRVLDRLGDGGVCQVFKARDTRNGRVVALKVLRQEWRSNRELIGRFRREKQVLIKLSHPNLVAAADANGKEPFYAMAYVEGTDLHQLVRLSGPMPVGRACEYVRQSALGLHHAHEHGLVHRDVKPSNLLLTPSGRVQVVDLGLAAITAGASQLLTQGTVGSPDYLAPEQARDSHQVDARADIYALGATLYYLLAGVPPFHEAKSVAQKLLMSQTKSPPSLSERRPDLPTGLVEVVQKAMSRDAAGRYASAAEMAEVLTQWAEPSDATLPEGALPIAPAADNQDTPVDLGATPSPSMVEASASVAPVASPAPVPIRPPAVGAARAWPRASLAANSSGFIIAGPDAPAEHGLPWWCWILVALAWLMGLAAFFAR
jgi:serine/threonine protein kinase